MNEKTRLIKSSCQDIKYDSINQPKVLQILRKPVNHMTRKDSIYMNHNLETKIDLFFKNFKCQKNKKYTLISFIIELNIKYDLKEILSIIYNKYSQTINKYIRIRINTFEDLYQLDIIMKWYNNRNIFDIVIDNNTCNPNETIIIDLLEFDNYLETHESNLILSSVTDLMRLNTIIKYFNSLYIRIVFNEDSIQHKINEYKNEKHQEKFEKGFSIFKFIFSFISIQFFEFDTPHTIIYLMFPDIDIICSSFCIKTGYSQCMCRLSSTQIETINNKLIEILYIISKEPRHIIKEKIENIFSKISINQSSPEISVMERGGGLYKYLKYKNKYLKYSKYT